MIRFDNAEQYRITSKQYRYRSNHGDPYGQFLVPVGPVLQKGPNRILLVQANDSNWEPCQGWEHVSVSVVERGGVTRPKLPTWAEMDQIKRLFWEPEDVAVQIHPAVANHVDNAEVLHLWRHPSISPPPIWMV